MSGFSLYSSICLYGEHGENFTNNNNNNNNNNTVFPRDIFCLRNKSVNTLHNGDDDDDDDNNNTIIIVITSLALL
jgi:hypothetical protein